MAVVQQTTKFGRIFWPVLAWTVAIVFFFPIFWMVLTSFKTDADQFVGQHVTLFHHFTNINVLDRVIVVAEAEIAAH